MRIYFNLLRDHRNFRYLWLAQVVSLLGDWFNTIASVILVNRYTDSGLAVSALFLARGLPPFIFGPLAGMVADRFNRRHILLLSDILRMVIVLGFLLVTQLEAAWLIYVLTASQFIVSAFFEPARAAILPSLVAENELLAANTLSNITWSTVLALGAALGGLVASQFGVETALIIDALTFCLSAFFIWQLSPNPRIKDTEAPPTSGFTEILDGFKYIAERPNIGIFTLVKGITQVGAVDIMFALYADQIFNVGKDGAITLGILYTFFGIGSVLGPMLGNWFGNNTELFLRRWITFGFLMLPIGWLGFSVAPFLVFAGFAMLIRGMGGSINWTYSSVVLQLKVPDTYLGRVFALDFSIFTLGYVISVLLTGFMADNLSIAPRQLAFWMGMGSIIAAFVWVIILRKHPYIPTETTKKTNSFTHEA